MSDDIPTFKIALIGGPNVGKTSMISFFMNGKFIETVNTVQASCLKRIIDIGGEQIELEIWDTAGQERYRSLAPMYFRLGDIWLVCFSYDSVESLEHASSMWGPQIRGQVGPSTVVMLVGIGFKLAREDYEMLEAVGESAFGDCPVKEEMVQKAIADIGADGFMYCCSQMKDSVNMVVEKAAEIYLEKQKEMGIETEKEQEEVEMEKKHKRRWWQRKHK